MAEKEEPKRSELIKKTTGENAPVKHNGFMKFVSRVGILAIVCVCVGMVIFLRSENSDRMKKYNNIQEQIYTLKTENDELELTLNSDDIGEYMEKLAIEKYGYAYPDETRYYDVSHN